MKLLPINTKKQRLKIYKLALKEDLNENTTEGLCIILRELSGRNSNNFTYTETASYFPEFRKYLDYYKSPVVLKYNKLYNKDSEKWRIKILNACIKQCLKP